eukprot:14262094-Alexandrium_andersonii.AAC.1
MFSRPDEGLFGKESVLFDPSLYGRSDASPIVSHEWVTPCKLGGDCSDADTSRAPGGASRGGDRTGRPKPTLAGEHRPRKPAIPFPE